MAHLSISSRACISIGSTSRLNFLSLFLGPLVLKGHLPSGIEGTRAHAVRAMGIRRSRYDGLAKTHVQYVLTAVAINLVRIDAVLTHHPRGKTRRSQFAQ
jgi:hypothetical protein